MEQIDIGTFLKRRRHFPVIDVRSPGEYEQGHILSALNMPLFNNEERAEVGTLYKQEGQAVAMKRGLDIVGPKMVSFIEFVEQLDTDTVLLYCWRGGKRSSSVGWLLENYGFSAHTLAGGYKSYRQALLSYFQQPLPLRILTGYTGSRKTETLHALASLGEQVVDLEGLARHQGSRFGNPMSSGQPTAEHFQNSLYEAFLPLDLSQPIWLEDESFRIGQVHMVEPLYHQKEKSPHLLIEVPKASRIEHLVQNYGRLPRRKLIEATRAIQKKLGGKDTQQAIDYLESGEIGSAAAIILQYYDRRYRKSIEKKQKLLTAHIKDETGDPQRVAAEIIKLKAHESISAHSI
jgi:tRNA 2-selenouridine synthase